MEWNSYPPNLLNDKGREHRIRSLSCKPTALHEAAYITFQLDSKDPSGNFHDFLMGEVRYASLVKSFPDEAKKLHAKLEEEYQERWETYKQMAE